MELPITAVGAFALGLGVWHLGVPVWFHIGRAVASGQDLPPVRMVPCRYGTSSRDVRGVAWIMNLAASYALITIGIACLAASRWLGTPEGSVLAAWIGGFWLVRAGAQLAMGTRPIDLAVMAWFGGLGVVCVLAGIA